MQGVRKMGDKTTSGNLPTIETGIELAPRQTVFLQYRDIEDDAWELYDSFKADGISLLRAIQIAVARYLENPKSGSWHWKTPDYARPYVPNSIRMSGNISPVWKMQRAKFDHYIVERLRARMCNKSRRNSRQ